MSIVFGQDLVLAWPWAFLAVPLPWLARRVLSPRRASLDDALRVPDPERFAVARAVQRDDADRVAMVLLAVMWLALVMAMARPQAIGPPLPLEQRGRDLMLAIDLSGSMAEQDLYAGDRAATRMAVVREVARDFVQRRTGDRIGLVMFGSEAYVQAPLTVDHDTVLHFLDEAVVGLAGRDTAIGDAIGLATKRLREAAADARVLILLTDGENSAGVVGPLDAAAVAADSGVRIHTIGVGSESRGLLGGMRRAAIDERSLRRIAEMSGGRYFRARSRGELEAIYAAIDEIEPIAGESEILRPLKEMQAWPLAIALLASLLWAARRARGVGRVVAPEPRR